MPDTSTEVALATTTLGSAAASIDFTSISSAYTDLRLVVVATSTQALNAGIRFNSNTGTNYSGTGLVGNGSSVSSSRYTSQTYLKLDNFDAGLNTTPVMYTIDIFNYAGSTFKTALVTLSGDTNGSGYVNRSVNLWRQTTAISSVSFYAASTGNLATGTTATLYGIL
jgi:hypothetical protein